MRLSRQVQASLFFLQKDFEHKKQQSAKLTIFTFLEVFVPEKLLPLLFSFFFAHFCFVGWFWFDLRFCALKIFFFFENKKELDWIEIALTASFTTVLTCTLINLPVKNLLVRTYIYL